MSENEETIPGFTKDQTWVLKRMAREAAEAAVEIAFETRECPRDCARLERVEAKAEQAHRFVFGRQEEGLQGADNRLLVVEGFVKGFNRLKWLVIGAVITAACSMIVALILLYASEVQRPG